MIWMDVDTALASVPVNAMPLVSSTDFVTIMDAVVYNQAGLALFWNFTTTAGVTTVTAITPTTGGTYDWTDFTTSGMYGIEIPASGGASINNDTEGFGHFTGVATGILPWAGPIIGFRAAALNNSLVDAGTTGLLAPTTAARTLNVSAGGVADADMTAISTDSTAADNLETMLDGTGGQTLSLGKLAVVAATGDAVVVSTAGGNGHGFNISGNGSGHGVRSIGGATGSGVVGIGGATSGSGIAGVGQTDSAGFSALGNGTGPGMSVTGGATGSGAEISAGGGVGKYGIDAVGSGAGGAGIGAFCTGTGNGYGIACVGLEDGPGFISSGDGAGNGAGMALVGTGAEAGCSITAGPADASGLAIFGSGTEPGLYVQGGATGAGILSSGGGTSGAGAVFTAQVDSDGLTVSGNGTGKDINAPNSDIGGIHVVELTAAALADFFTVDSGETYASAVAGSVVKEIADNASANPATIATAVWAEAVPGAFVAGSAGFILGTNLNAQITSRMATYTQPTGFLAATFPAGTVASTTNLTAGTIATVTNDVGITQAGADKVWLTAARTLTSGANIVLAKGVGVTGFNDLSAAQVNAEMVDVIAVDTYAEPTGAPPATTTLALKIGRLHQVLRNKLTVTATTLTLFDDAGAALWTKPLADNGVTYTESEGS